MHASQTTRRMRAYAGAGALLAAGALAGGLAVQPGTALAGDPSVEPSASAQTDAGTTTTSAAMASTWPAEVEPADGCVTVGVSGTYDTTAARALLSRVNEIRDEAYREGILGCDDQPIAGYRLTWDSGLEHAAQVRAAECALSLSSVRPDGSGLSVEQAHAGDNHDNTFLGTEGTVIWAENQASGTDAASCLESWYAEKAAYERWATGDESVTHDQYDRYRALISDVYTRVGIGAFTTADGTTYVVAEFSDEISDSSQVRPDGPCTQQVNVAANTLTASVSMPQGASQTLVAGQTMQLTAGLSFAGTTAVSPASPLTWASSDESVATVDPTGLVSAQGAGSATISVGMGAGPLVSLDLAVSPATVSVPDVTGMTVDDARAALEQAGLALAPGVMDGPAAADATQDGLVCQQSPEAGAQAPVGSSVTLTAYTDYVAPTVTGADVPDALETQEGVAPELPITAQVTWSDGSVTTEDVVWDAIDPASYAQAGSFEVSGTVGETGLTVGLTVNVIAKPAPTISSVEDASVTTPSGTAPALPQTVTATMSDGSQADVAVTWAEADPTQYSARDGGSFDVEGTVEGFAGAAVAHVTVEAAQITDVADPGPLSTTAGTAPSLPATVRATWSNGDQTDQPVKWEQLLGLTADGKGTWDFPGQVTLEGSVEGTDIPAHVTVDIAERPAPTIVSVEDVSVQTESGTAPALPQTVTATMSDETQTDVPVTWAAIDPAQYSARGGGSFEVTGTVEGLAGSAVAHVTVQAASIVDVAESEPLTTFVGHAPSLPATVRATWSNGDQTDQPVEWEQLLGLTADGKGTWDFAGQVTLTGAVEGTDMPASVTVTVRQPGVASVASPADVATRAGVAPTLPATVQVTWEDGSVTDEKVTWDAVSPDSYAQEGSFAVQGTVGTADGAKVSVTVNVSALPAIAAVESVPDVTTPSGTAPTLPTSVTVTWDDGSTSAGTVTWDAVERSAYAMREGGSFDVRGTVSATHGTGADACDATADASVHVTVSPATVASVEQPAAVTTHVKSAPALPQAVKVTWSNGDVTDEAVTWETIDAAAWNTAGTVTVAGSVGATGQTVKLTVTVQAAKATAVQSIKVSTPAGVAPTLPATVQVTWDDGSVTDEPVSWDAISADAYASEGSFDVSGTLGSAVGLQTLCHVSVEAPVAVGARLDTSSVTTVAGVAPTLPQSATVTMSDGGTQTADVAWDDVDAASYAKPGTFTVDGTAAGFNVRVTVSVSAPVVTAAADVTVNTTAGVAPALPATVKVTWSDGQVTNVPVTWGGVDASLYAREGSFDVRGVASNLSVTAHVVVGPTEVAQTGDATTSPVLLAMIGAGGVLAAAAGVILKLRGKRRA